MSGSGPREGFGSPPWNRADPAPGTAETRPIPGLGKRRETGSGSATGGGSPANNGAGANGTSGAADTSVDLPAIGDGGSARGATSNGAAPGGAGPGEPGGGNTGPDGGEPDDAAPDKTGQSPGAHAAGKKRRRKGRSFWRELPVLIVVALVLALVIKTYAIQAFFIPSGSMQNTLEIGDRVLINKLVYHVRGIARGDVVVFNGDGSWDVTPPPGSSNVFSKFAGDLEDIVGANHNNDVYIKRVIGLPGDHVACCNAQGQMTVNGVALTEGSYLYPGNAPSNTPFNITVPPGRLWVMGDHRAISYDSRGHMGDPGGGTIPESAVMGRAFVIIWPPSRWGFLNIPATFEQPKLTGSAAAAGGSPQVLAAAMAGGTPLQASWTVLPLALGFAGAVPLTLLQRSARRRLSARRSRRRGRSRLPVPPQP
jgi:signal peptidase I